MRMVIFVILALFKNQASAEVRLGVTAFVEVDRKVLLLQRADDEKVFPGFFVLPGGSVDAGETLTRAAERELMEEAGLVGEVVETYNSWGWTWIIRGTHVKFEITSFRMRIAGDLTVTLSHEHNTNTWASVGELASLKIPPAVKDDLLIGFGAKRSLPPGCTSLLSEPAPAETEEKFI